MKQKILREIIEEIKEEMEKQAKLKGLNMEYIKFPHLLITASRLCKIFAEKNKVNYNLSHINAVMAITEFIQDFLKESEDILSDELIRRIKIHYKNIAKKLMIYATPENMDQIIPMDEIMSSVEDLLKKET